MVDTVRDLGYEGLLPLAFDFAEDMSCVHRDPKLLMIGADESVSGEEMDTYVRTLGRWNGACMYQPLTTERAAWRDGLVTYIHTTADMTVPLDYQKVFVKRMRDAGVEVQCVSIETGHCPNLTRPEEVAKIVGKIANGQVLGDDNEVNSNQKASTRDVEGAIKSVGAQNA